ncbi:MAG: hypothetical protein WCX65_14450 [bacterium]
MNLKKYCGIYSLSVGVIMAIVWVIYFLTGSVMGAKPAGSGLGFHIAAEFLTAFALSAAGIGLLVNRKWGRDLYFLGLGLLIYALVNSPGYYMNGPGGIFILAVFAMSFVCSVIFLIFGFYFKD